MLVSTIRCSLRGPAGEAARGGGGGGGGGGVGCSNHPKFRRPSKIVPTSPRL